MAHKPFAKLKGFDREMAIDNAAHTLKEFARIKKDKPLLKAARAELKKQIADAKKAITI